MGDDHLRVGSHVKWKSSQGWVTGKIVERKTSDFDVKGTHLTASEDEPKFLVESDETGERAGHEPSALHRV